MGERMEKHLGHAPVIEELVAQFDLAIEGPVEEIADDPSPPEPVEEVEPVIVDVDHQQAARRACETWSSDAAAVSRLRIIPNVLNRQIA